MEGTDAILDSMCCIACGNYEQFQVQEDDTILCLGCSETKGVITFEQAIGVCHSLYLGGILACDLTVDYEAIEERRKN